MILVIHWCDIVLVIELMVKLGMCMVIGLIAVVTFIIWVVVCVIGNDIVLEVHDNFMRVVIITMVLTLFLLLAILLGLLSHLLAIVKSVII